MKTSRKSIQDQAYCRWYVPLDHLQYVLLRPSPHRQTQDQIQTAARYVASFLHTLSNPSRHALQFFITTAKCDFLDGKHVVFGRVIDGMLTLRKIENVPTGPNNRPKLAVKVVGKEYWCIIHIVLLLTFVSSPRVRRNVSFHFDTFNI